MKIDVFYPDFVNLFVCGVNNHWTCNCVSTLQPICPGRWEAACVRPVIFSATKFSVILHSSFSLAMSIKYKSIPLPGYCSVFLWADVLSLLSRLCHSLSHPVLEKMSAAGWSHFWPASFFLGFSFLAWVNINRHQPLLPSLQRIWAFSVTPLSTPSCGSFKSCSSLAHLQWTSSDASFLQASLFLTESYFEVLS